MPKTTRRVRVAFGERLRPVGELVFETDGRRQASMFRYADEWRNAPEGFAIAPTMPLSESPFHASASRERPRSALLGPFGDGAPDSWGRGLLRKSFPGSLTELHYLLPVDDETRQGALRYLDDGGKPLARTYPPVPRLSDLDELRRLAGAAEDDPNGLPTIRDRLVGSASSLGGARPKANVRDRGGDLAIAKFTSDRDTMPVERVEVATLALARVAGVNAALARIELGSTDKPVALIKRFDRAAGDRVHYLSAQSFIGAEAGTSAYYTDIADALRAHALDPTAQLTELYRRVLFTILVSNNDDHLKNHGLLHAGGGRWVLSPAFDVNPQPHRQRHLETGISELSGHAASIEAAVDAAPFFDIEHAAAVVMLSRMASTIDERWRACCAAAGMTAREIERYEPAFDHTESRTARRITRRRP